MVQVPEHETSDPEDEDEEEGTFSQAEDPTQWLLLPQHMADPQGFPLGIGKR